MLSFGGWYSQAITLIDNRECLLASIRLWKKILKGGSRELGKKAQIICQDWLMGHALGGFGLGFYTLQIVSSLTRLWAEPL